MLVTVTPTGKQSSLRLKRDRMPNSRTIGEQTEKNMKKMKKMKLIGTIATVALLATSLVCCTSKSNSNKSEKMML